MKDVFQAVRVTDRVWWVGAIDWTVRDFHGYLTGGGTTYNAYLVTGDEPVLLDTVKAPFFDEMLARVASVVDPAEVRYVVSNHSEPDHTGALAATLSRIRPEKTFASAQGVKALQDHYGLGGQVTAIEDGQELKLGGSTFRFAETRMCHWPDSMVTYLAEEKLLVSQDAFGMHLATYERFDDELPAPLLKHEAARYYANILLPLSGFVTKALEKLEAAGWELDLIAPDHGPIWRSAPGGIVADYARWARQPRGNKAVVVYDTMWQSTDLMARAVGEGLRAGGAAVRLMPLSGSHRSDVATEMLDAGALLVGAPTINNEIFPTLADCLTYLKGLRPQGVLGAAFGSYGWSGEAAKDLSALLTDMKVEVVAEPVRSKYVPDDEVLRQCHALGRTVAAALADRG